MRVFAPKTEEELARAAAEGLLEESHNLDVKSSISSGPGANKELARDLASFAIDGGTYIVGVDETTAPPSLVPVPVDGLAERVEQVALARVDAPLAVRSTVIRTSTNPVTGTLSSSFRQARWLRTWSTAATGDGMTRRSTNCPTPV